MRLPPKLCRRCRLVSSLRRFAWLLPVDINPIGACGVHHCFDVRCEALAVGISGRGEGKASSVTPTSNSYHHSSAWCELDSDGVDAGEQ